MKTFDLRVTFDTPAFLGDAEQSGRWRTPPFKSLLRQWWRVAYAAGRPSVETAEMRVAEGRLFGSAAGGSGQRSLVRLRFDGWQSGALRADQWKAVVPGFVHSEVKGGITITADTYLGFGRVPPTAQGKTTLRKANGCAIDEGEHRQLGLALAPRSDKASESAAYCQGLTDTLSLINLYGTVGGRSRNGWGSLRLEGPDLNPFFSVEPYLCNWRELIANEWASGIGKDDRGPLVWSTGPHESWRAAMSELAKVRYLVRTKFSLAGLPSPHRAPTDRHWLAYPVTGHVVSPWGRNARLPNTLRFKVRRSGDSFTGVVFHMPAKPVDQPFRPDPAALVRVWSVVHATLDEFARDGSALRLQRVKY